MNDTTRRYPRTLTEAFGPYAHGKQLHTPHKSMHAADKIVVVASALAGVAMLGMFLVGWL